MNNEQNESTQNKNYQLKSKAVEELVDAKSGNVPQYTDEELRRYRSRSKIKIPMPIQVLLCKAWFAAAVCYFIFMGLGRYIGSNLDMLFVLAIALGLVTDLLTNNVIRFIEAIPHENEGWLLVQKKGVVGLLLNLVMSGIIVVCVFLLYTFVNKAVSAATGKPDGTITLAVEPILYGLFCLGFEMLLLGIKRLLLSIVSDAKEKALDAVRRQDDK